MTKKQKPTKRQIYDDYWERCKDLPTLKYKAPCCGEELKTRKPGDGETWDTMVECVHCTALFWMEATPEGVNEVLNIPVLKSVQR